MKTLLLLAVALLLSCTTTLAVPPARKKMKAFTSERELQRYFRRIADKQKRAAERRQELLFGTSEVVTITGADSYIESVTNTQHAGVDEGGIVKLHGDHLVILRRGRLFTVAIGGGSLTQVSSVDAFGPEIDPAFTWYDEMLVSEDTVVVIGYSYKRGGTEVGLFNIDAGGNLSYRSTYHLRSNDYYSSRNYSSRLIGNKLIFYSPLRVYSSDGETFRAFPAVRKWHRDATDEQFRRIVSARRFYYPQADFAIDDAVSLHTVTICNLANRGFDCEATSVIGPPGHVFYVSPDSVYVWASSWGENGKQPLSFLFRMPLDGSGPSALRTWGGPVDQFSFLQSEDRHLNVLVRSETEGDGMWGAEVTEGDVALLRVPLWSFSDGSDIVPATSYRPLPDPQGAYFQNRFVGDYVIYGTGTGYARRDLGPLERDLFVVEWARGNLQKLTLPHGADRIEQMGSGAVIIGGDGKNLHFTSMRLNPQPEVVSRYVREDALQGETRSHGFFYKPDGDNSGTLGLPIDLPGQPGYFQLFKTSAGILFLRNEALQFRVVGELAAQAEKVADDHCRASCTDWYGNARPLFVRGRVFALLGYELVEGELVQGRMTELRRINYASQVVQP
ncbi:MAG TPA: beta-propeller domain-containing protein [Pyrinomonadaceae bacterium]|nr:beta-propeller domain-containing protein [Pyrinomonadaceae bacterium]